MDSPLASALLEQLQPLFAEPDFDILFNRLTEGETKSARFLLKMELNRLWSPCIRVIDMRSKGYPCEVFEHSGIRHYLSTTDKTIFLSALQRYQDRYTTGVYEIVIAESAQQSQDSFDIKRANSNNRLKIRTIEFGSYQQGREERIHFSTPITMTFDDGQKIKAKTSNLSINGIRINLLEPSFYEIGQMCEIRFDGLEKEMPRQLVGKTITYQIRGEEHQEQQTWLRMSFEDNDNNLFSQFLNTFIEQNKAKYKVSIDYAFSATEVKGYEQFYLPRMTGIPLFFSEQGKIKLEYILKTENNLHEMQYWRDERNHDVLDTIFNQDRMANLIAQSGPRKHDIIYAFTHTVRSHIYFFSATESELQESGLKNLFFSVGSKRPSWRIYQFMLDEVNAQINYDHLIDPTITTEQYRASLIHQIQKIRYIGYLNLISLEHHIDDCKEWQPVENDANLLRRFGHKQASSPFQIEALYYPKLRREPRYIHKTAVVVRFNDLSLVGWTRDISTFGMQIELESPLPCVVGNTLNITLPKMQQLIKQLDLSSLHYTVMNVNNTHTILNLMIDGEPDIHVGREFFHMLIAQNQQKLEETKEPRHYRGLSTSLRNLFVNHKFNYALYIDRHYASKLGILGIGKQRQTLDTLFLNPERTEADLIPLFKGERLKQCLIVPLNQAKREDRPVTVELYILQKMLHDGSMYYDIHYGSAFEDTYDKKEFIQDALLVGHFYSVQLMISRTGRPDMEYLAKELDYIAKYAIHKAKQLEESLWSIVGVCDLIDTTEATLARLGITH